MFHLFCMCMKGDPKVSVFGPLRASPKKAFIESHKTKLLTRERWGWGVVMVVREVPYPLIARHLGCRAVGVAVCDVGDRLGLDRFTGLHRHVLGFGSRLFSCNLDYSTVQTSDWI